jgi:hypothetical protein
VTDSVNDELGLRLYLQLWAPSKYPLIKGCYCRTVSGSTPNSTPYCPNTRPPLCLYRKCLGQATPPGFYFHSRPYGKDSLTWGTSRACETCRSRKQKCDEQRPKCSLCSRMKLDCVYRDPQPTKKDKTLVEILDRLKSLEGKVDRIPTNRPPPGFGPLQSSPSSQPSFNPEVEAGSYSASSVRPSQQPSPSGIGRSQPYRHASAAHKILTWPAIQQLLLQAHPSNLGDLKSLEQDGSNFIVRMQKGQKDLPLDEALQEWPFVGMQTPATRASGGARTTFPALTREVMHRLATTYFDTFNFLYPFMDRQNFISDTLTRVHTEGFDGDIDSVIALLVFALGELTIEGSRGTPISSEKNRPSGVRGGSSQKPPGLALFNEARKRIGFVLTGCDLENVQIFSLAAFVDSLNMMTRK